MKKILPFAFCSIALLLLAGALLFFENDLLWKVQELNLFLNTSLFFKQQLLVPGGLLTYVATFFTQFFYHPWTGAMMLYGWWLLLTWLTKRAFQLSDKWPTLTLIPVILILTTIVDMGYWIYVLKLRGHLFVTTIGTTAIAALLWGFRCLSAKPRAAYVFMTVAVGYPIMGIYALAAALLMGIYTWRLEGSRNTCLLLTAEAVASVVTMPLIYYRYVYFQTNLGNIYWAELPLFVVAEEHHAYYLPYYLLAAFFLLLAIGYRRNLGSHIMKSCRTAIAVQSIMLAIMGYGLYHFWNKDENFHNELSMMRCLEQCDWDGVLKTAARQEKEPTSAITMMKNIALARLNRQSTEMYRYKNGSRQPEAPFPMSLMQMGGVQVYYNYGMTNYSYRLCMELGVEYSWRAEYLKYMIRCALLNGENNVARKYIKTLKHTCYFKDWAEWAEGLLGNREAQERDQETGFITHMMQYPDLLGSDQGDTQGFVMKRLNKLRSNDPVFQEQALIASLWLKDETAFWYHFSDYVRLHPNQPIPRYFQEAAYFFALKEERPDIGRMPFDQGIKESFDRFMEAASPYEGSEPDVAKHALMFFSDTYYYDYFLMPNLR
jgi:hypothetical protein